MKSLIVILSFLGLFAQAQDPSKMDTGKMMDSAKTKATAMASACKDDQVKLCPDMKTVETIQTCLKGNYDKLTPACKDSMKTKK